MIYTKKKLAGKLPVYFNLAHKTKKS